MDSHVEHPACIHYNKPGISNCFRFCPTCGHEIDVRREQWEYRYTYIALNLFEKSDDGRLEELGDILNFFGHDGWEIVYITPSLLDMQSLDGYAWFKRKVEK